MIRVQNLTKKYGDRLALDQVSFSVAGGEVVGFLGPNGAGKTTTMRILTGCLAPTSGTAEIDGKDVFEYPVQTKEKLGYLPEIPPLYGDMYVEDYLKYVGQIKRCPARQLKDQVDSCVKKTGLSQVRSRLIQNLSKGYRQRVGIAQALMNNPDVLILDEPTVGLDPAQVIEIRGLIGDLKHHHTVILSTHILSEVEANCERVIIIHQGKVAVTGELSELRQKMHQKSLSVRVEQPSSQLLSQLQALDGVKEVQDERGIYNISVSAEASNVNDLVARTVIDSGAGFLELKENKFNLEDIFIHITRSQGGGS
ncbi:MAG: ATP-binding cassette domain-containing protein [Bdellovibrionales bacterium]|nr:ATP-binding cassette domain-containing protein [Bdellovibrionales bacterium]